MAVPTTSRGWFDYYYPYFSVEGDPRYASADKIATALAIAVDYAPDCPAVSDAEILRAIAHYAAYELGVEYENRIAASGVALGSVLIREKEGDTEKQWSPPQAGTTGASGAKGDASPYARWLAIANLCPQPFVGFTLRSRRI